jgi:hypothetical protein
MTPCILLKVDRRFREILPPSSWQNSTLGMEAICSFEISVEFQQTTRRYIAEIILFWEFCVFNFRTFTNSDIHYKMSPSLCYYIAKIYSPCKYIKGKPVWHVQAREKAEFLREIQCEMHKKGREADHSPPISAEIKKMWIYTSTPPCAFMA